MAICLLLPLFAGPAAWVARVALMLFVLGCALVPLRAARAQEAAPPADAALAAQVAALAAPAAPGLRVEVQLGALDPRLKLAPCGRIEPYLPAGTRPWGRTRIGLRCTDGSARWNVSLPVTVRVFGPALVAASALPAGATLAGSEFSRAEVDLAAEPAPALADAAALAGRTLARPLAAGEPLRASHLRARQWFAAGDTVQLSAVGPGFRIGGTAQALTPGIEGQAARVRTESGRVLTGQPTGAGRVDVVL